jgi:hypothetical protein
MNLLRQAAEVILKAAVLQIADFKEANGKHMEI